MNVNQFFEILQNALDRVPTQTLTWLAMQLVSPNPPFPLLNVPRMPAWIGPQAFMEECRARLLLVLHDKKRGLFHITRL